MHQAHLNVNGVRTKVVTFGRWVEEEPQNEEPEDIVILITGNPGITRFYTAFLQTLYEQVQYPVWAVGHAGHEPPKNFKTSEIPILKGNEKLYGLKGQIQHKIDFIEKYVPKNARIHFVGHSIGTCIILELLKIQSINDRVVANYLLFPTIEHMAETPNGKFLTNTIKHIMFLVMFGSWFFNLLPLVIQNFLVYVYIRINSIPKMHLKTIVGLIHPGILDKIFYMAFEEMDHVKERNNDIIRANVKKLKFYYSAADNWAPASYCEKLKDEIPDVNAEVCVRGFTHTFVFNNSRDVGNMVGGWIKEKAL